MEKYRALSDPDLWTDYAAWEKRLRSNVEEIDEELPQKWVELDEHHHSESLSAVGASALIAPLTDYFRQVRFPAQMAYFEDRAIRYQGIDSRLKHWPPRLFFASVVL